MVFKIIWLSSNKFGYELLKKVVSDNRNAFEISAIFTLKKSSPTIMYDGIPVRDWYKFGIPVHEIDNINDQVKEIEDLKPHLIIMCGWRQILNASFVENPHFKIIGFHPTLLPKGRGPAPLINTILEGIEKSGVTLFYIGKNVDDGDIIGQEPFLVASSDHASDVYKKMIKAGKTLIKSYLPLIIEGNAPRIPQSEKDATYFTRRKLSDNEFFPDSDSPDIILKKIRAFSKPYKGAYFIKGNKKVILWSAEIEEINE